MTVVNKDFTLVRFVTIILEITKPYVGSASERESMWCVCVRVYVFMCGA